MQLPNAAYSILTPLLLATPAVAQLDAVQLQSLQDAPDQARRTGQAIDIEGEWMVVGSAQYGPDNTTNNAGSRSGAVFLYRRDGLDWVLHQVLRAGQPTFAGHFGRSLDLQGSRLAIGAPKFPTNGQGRVHVFDFDATTEEWQETAVVTPAAPQDGEDFGFSVALLEDRLWVGAPEYDEALIADAGRAVVFSQQPSGMWAELASLTSPLGVQINAEFGHALDALGDRAVVSEPLRDSGYVHTYDTAGPTPQVLGAPLTTTSSLTYGYSLDLDGSRLAVGAPDLAGGFPGSFEGSVLLYTADPLGWSQEATLFLQSDDELQLGHDVALDGTRLVAGAPGPHSNGEGLSGGVLLFSQTGSQWTLARRFYDGLVRAGDDAGFGVALQGDTLAFGAPSRDVASIGAQASAVGIAHVFRISTAHAEPFGFGDGSNAPCCSSLETPALLRQGCPSSVGTAINHDRGGHLGVIGSTSLANADLRFAAVHLPSAEFGLLFQFTTPVNGGMGIQLAEGILLGTTAITRFDTLMASSSGRIVWEEDYQQEGSWSAGQTRYFQAWFRDGSSLCGTGSNLTNGLEVTFQP